MQEIYQGLMGYTEWRKFEEAIERAKIACKNSGQLPGEQFVPACALTFAISSVGVSAFLASPDQEKRTRQQFFNQNC